MKPELFVVLTALVLFLNPTLARAVVGQTPYVRGTACSGDFPLVEGRREATIWVDPADQAGVARAAEDLAGDIGKVTGQQAQVVRDQSQLCGPAVLVGTLGHSAVIDGLVRQGKLDVRGVAGEWEAFVSGVVEQPLPGVERALVIAGSNRRGTIFGIYDLCEQIGVSPWHFWADVPPRQRDALFVAPGLRKQGPPSVRFRGIWVNDNHLIAGWSRRHMDEGVAFGPNWCRHVAELLLRLKANFMWVPAPPRDFYDHLEENFAVLHEYGIWVGSAHNKQLQRDNVWDWHEWVPANIPGAKPGQEKRAYWPYWDYEKYGQYIRQYWEERVRKIAAYDVVWSVGIRGVGDRPMIGGDSRQEKARRVERVIADQREILARLVDPEVETIPQQIVFYNEVLGLYHAGMRIPEDITLVWPDDNQGWIRDLPSEAERDRSGGHGVYYHVSYTGSSGKYLWLNSTPIPMIWEEMDKAYRAEAKDLWILNAGDIKPAEIAVDFFLTMAWDAGRWNASNLREYHVLWARREFGPEHADRIADLVIRHFQRAIAHRPEFIEPECFLEGEFSLTAYGDEAQRRTDEYLALAAEARRIQEALPGARRDAFYQLVTFPIEQTARTWQQHVANARAIRYAEQGRASAGKYMQIAEATHEAIREAGQYYNRSISGGKWEGIMSIFRPSPRWGARLVDGEYKLVSNFNPETEPHPVEDFAPPQAPGLGIAVEGQPEPGEAPLHFSVLTGGNRFVDVFNRGTTPFAWTAAADASWVHLSERRGMLEGEHRLQVSIDWDSAPRGTARTTLTVRGADAERRIPVHIDNRRPALPAGFQGYIEAGGYVSMETEKFNDQTDRGEQRWRVVKHLGHSGDAVKGYPDVGEAQTDPQHAAENAAELTYDVYFASSGTFPVTLYMLPQAPHWGTRANDCAVALDDQPPVDTQELSDYGERNHLQRSRAQATITVEKPGVHRLRIFALQPGVILDRIVIDTGGVLPSHSGPPESYRAAG